jgi:hypothetical protein
MLSNRIAIRGYGCVLRLRGRFKMQQDMEQLNVTTVNLHIQR